jgi:hypothetical protein
MSPSLRALIPTPGVVIISTTAPGGPSFDVILHVPIALATPMTTDKGHKGQPLPLHELVMRVYTRRMLYFCKPLDKSMLHVQCFCGANDDEDIDDDDDDDNKNDGYDIVLANQAAHALMPAANRCSFNGPSRRRCTCTVTRHFFTFDDLAATIMAIVIVS